MDTITQEEYWLEYNPAQQMIDAYALDFNTLTRYTYYERNNW